MQDVQVIDDPAAATAAMDPLRGKILAALRNPGSATSLVPVIGLPRQQLNYHLRTLEQLGLVRHVESRARRGLTERIMASTAKSYVLSPALLGAGGAEPERVDRLSSAYLIAVAARLLREVAALVGGAERAGKPLATLTIDTEVHFATPADRAAFTTELAQAVTTLAGRYHAPQSPGARAHRLVVAAHPIPQTPADPTQEDRR